MKGIFIAIFFFIMACSPKVAVPDPDALKPSWLKTHPSPGGYFTGIGHSRKDGTNNYVQAAKKSALDDLVSQIKVNVSSTSILSQFEADRKFSEQYEQIIQTTTAEEIEEFELVDTWEDASNYWTYYRLSVSRYRQIKEEQKRNATTLALDYFTKARQSEKTGERLEAISLYFQAFRALEKHLGEPIRITHEDREILLVNEIYASIQRWLNSLSLSVDPAEIQLNRRVQNSAAGITVKANYRGDQMPVSDIPLIAGFDKGSGDIFPTYKTNSKGEARIMLNRIASKELDQTILVKVDIDKLSGSATSPVYNLVARTMTVPRAQVNLKVQRPVVFVSSEEKSLGYSRNTSQLTNRLKNLLANNGFEFTNDKGLADLWFDVKSDSEKGSVTGSIYVTYLTGVIKVTSAKEGREIYATVLDRVKGFGLDYEKSSVDAYNKATEALEKEKMTELIEVVLQ